MCSHLTANWESLSQELDFHTLCVCVCDVCGSLGHAVMVPVAGVSPWQPTGHLQSHPGGDLFEAGVKVGVHMPVPKSPSSSER